MPRADFFSLFHLFVVRNFFDAELCRQLRDEMRVSSGSPATVREADGAFTVDPFARRVTYLQVPDAAVALATERLLALRPRIEAHFGTPLAGCERPQFLFYQVGDHYRPHRDNSAPGVPEDTSQRQVSVVLFLNGQAGDSGEDSFAGGSLTFYGLLPETQGQQVGLPLEAETGLLVAFRSDLRHAVFPVERGNRYTVVTWFLRP